ncbi:MAG: TolC family protein, partial [Alphaproteobacteria bacterium]|nr:TolC family protein [Alphaproteobacteria bacterium]
RRVDAFETQVRAQVAQAWYGYDAATRAIEASRRQVEAAEIAYEGAKEELAVGVRTTLDVLDQEQQLFEARLALVGAERDAYVAAHQLLRATGGLDTIG